MPLTHAAKRLIKRLLLLGLALVSVGTFKTALSMVITHPTWDVLVVGWSDGANIEGESEAEGDDRAIWARESDMTSGGDPPVLHIYPFEAGQGSRLGFERVGD